MVHFISFLVGSGLRWNLLRNLYVEYFDGGNMCLKYLMDVNSAIVVRLIEKWIAFGIVYIVFNCVIWWFLGDFMQFEAYNIILSFVDCFLKDF